MSPYQEDMQDVFQALVASEYSPQRSTVRSHAVAVGVPNRARLCATHRIRLSWLHVAIDQLDVSQLHTVILGIQRYNVRRGAHNTRVLCGVL